MSLEHIDIQCTVVARASPQRIIRALRLRAVQNAWHVEKLESTDLASDPLSPDETWPAETLGEMVYRTEAGISRTLFWSTYAQGDLSRFTLGLYIREYAPANQDLRQACDTAIDAMTALFDSTDSLCIVVSFEDEILLAVAPLLAGRYRTDLWQTIGLDCLPGLTVKPIYPGWIEARPLELATNSHLGLAEASEPARRSLRALQDRLEAIFWGTPREVRG